MSDKAIDKLKREERRLSSPPAEGIRCPLSPGQPLCLCAMWRSLLRNHCQGDLSKPSAVSATALQQSLFTEALETGRNTQTKRLTSRRYWFDVRDADIMSVIMVKFTYRVVLIWWTRWVAVLHLTSLIYRMHGLARTDRGQSKGNCLSAVGSLISYP